MAKLQLYTVGNKYITYLFNNVSKHVFTNKGEGDSARKYLGIVLSVNGYNYFAPLSSPKVSDYNIKDGNKVLRKSIIPIIRMTNKRADGSIEFLGTIKLGSMIPVPKSELNKYDVRNETDLQYQILIRKQLRFISRNNKMINKNASVLYRQKTSGKEGPGYINSTFDFKKFENAHDSWIEEHTSESKTEEEQSPADKNPDSSPALQDLQLQTSTE